MRRSLFGSDPERNKFLNNLVLGTLAVMRSQAGLQHHANYHDFCRLLGRLKTNYQLSELVGTQPHLFLVCQFQASSFTSCFEV